MARTVDNGKARVHEHLSEQLDAPLVFPAERLAFFTLQDLDGFPRARQQHGRQRGGEDEAGGERAHRVHQSAGAGDVTPHAAERLAWK